MGFTVRIKQRWRKWTLPTKFTIVMGIFGLPPVLAWYLGLFHSSLDPVLSFHMSTTGIGLAPSGSAALSFSEIHERRVHTLFVENPTEIPLYNLVFACQFPEAVISVRNAAPSASVQVNSYENWDNLPNVVEGKINKQQAVEQFETRQITGLWQITINSIPAQTRLNLEFVTTADSGSGLYNEWVLKEGDSLSIHELVFHVTGTYQFMAGASFSKKRFLLPLKYYPAKRTIEAGDVLRDSESHRNIVRVRQAKGFRLPGYFKTMGYILLETDPGERFLSFFSPVSLERLHGIQVQVGMFGNPLNPGYMISGTDSLSPSH